MEEVAIAVVFAVTGWMLKTWLTHQERMKELSVERERIGSAEQRLAQVEHAVEAIAVEVERIGEGQRYVTSLLDGRAQPALEARVGEPRAAAAPDRAVAEMRDSRTG
jgi:hypothetical protein